MLLAAIPVALAGCQSSSTLDVGIVLPERSPVSETTEIRDADGGSVIGDYTHREPVEPRPWREQNREVSPDLGDEDS